MKYTFEQLSDTMKKIVSKKAKENGISVDEYLEHTNDNYCIEDLRGRPICFGDNPNSCDYIVYGSFEDAKADLQIYQMIVTETSALIYFNNTTI